MFLKHSVAYSAFLFGALGLGMTAAAQQADQLPIDFLKNTNPTFHSDLERAKAMSSGIATAGKAMTSAAVDTYPNADTIPSFNGSFDTPGFDSNGNPVTHWLYNMVGAPPESHRTTLFPAPIIPVSLDLRNADGTPRYVNGKRMYYDATQYVLPVLGSPVFDLTWYSSSDWPTQYTDAVQLATFAEKAEEGWHNLLIPEVKRPRVMTLLAGTYYFSLNTDGSCCAYVLIDENTFSNKLFPPTYPVDNSTVIGAAELAGDMTTHDITSLLFPNAYLYSGGDPNNCCVLGFHSFDSEPGTKANGDKNRYYVMNYASWISPGLFGSSFADVTALSHELAETFNDPFVVADGVHNLTPWWLAPNGLCQNNLEVGDVIEGLSDATHSVTLHGYTYHPQNVALLPWFEFRSPSNALDRAYSYPDENVLTSLSAPQKAGCAP